MFAKFTSAGILTLAFCSLLSYAACGGGSGTSSTPPAATTPTAPTPTPAPGGGGSAQADVVISIVGMNGNQSFSPNPANVKVGQTVAWRNADSLTHTATANDNSFNTGNVGRDATSAPITMSAAGSIPYACRIHPSMVGTLNVTP